MKRKTPLAELHPTLRKEILSVGGVKYIRSKLLTKDKLIKFMEACDFGPIVDVKYEQGIEWVGHPVHGSDEIVYFEIDREGSGFVRLFSGAIRGLKK